MKETIKTSVLFASLTALLLVAGYLIGGTSGLIGFLVISMLFNLGSFWFSDKIALAMSQSRPIAAGELPQIQELTADLAAKMGIPTPRLFVSPQLQPNAFATGRGPGSSAVSLTQGLINQLPTDQLAGVIAHELAHIKNRDVLTATIAAVIAGLISGLANIAIFMPRNDEEQNPLAALLMLFFAPIAATLIQLAISRSREFAADELAAKTIGRGEPLANALINIESWAQQAPMQINPAMASLYIANPLGKGGLLQLFSTHPATADRVARLMNI